MTTTAVPRPNDAIADAGAERLPVVGSDDGTPTSADRPSRVGRLGALSGSRSRRLLATAWWAVLLAAFSARRRHLYPVLGVDPSYYTALAWTSQQGVLHGRDIVFTYGPLGWLQGAYDFDPNRGALAAAFALAWLIAACAVVVLALARKHVRLWFAAPIAVLVGGVLGSMQSAELAATTTFALGLVLVMERPVPTWAAAAYAALFGAALALVTFIKTDTAIRLATAAPLVGALCIKTPAEVPRGRRSLVVSMSASVAALVVVTAVWAQEGFANGPAYLRGAAEMAAGFAGAMGIESNPRWEYAAAAATVLLAVLLGHRAVRRDVRTVRACTFGALLAFSWVVFKALSLVAAGITNPMPVLFDLAAAQASVADTGAAFRSGGHPSTDNEIVRAQIMGQVPDPVLAAVGTGSLHVEPDETAFAWAIITARGGRWDPIPTIQTYHGYTPYLDDRNAAFIASPTAPDIVLYRRADGDWDQAWQSPSYKAALFCHYDPIVIEGEWRVLARRGVSICAAPVEVATVRASRGADSMQIVDVPAVADDEMLTATFSDGPINSTPRLLELAFKPAAVSVTADPGHGSARAWPFVEAVAGQPHVVAFPRCWRSGDRVDPRQPQQLGFSGGFRPGSQRAVRATFSTSKVACPPTPDPAS